MSGENEEKLTKAEEKESFIKQLRQSAEENKRLLEEIREERERIEELKAREILSGRTDAGVQPVAVKPDTPQDYIRKVMSGEIKLE